MRILIAVVSLLLMLLVLALAPAGTNLVETPDSSRAASLPDAPETFWIKVVFGIDGAAASWDGRLSLEGGKLLDSEGYCLERRDKIEWARQGSGISDILNWTITTGIVKARQATFAELMRGFLVKVEASDDTVAHVETKQGRFSFKPGELTPGRPKSVLSGKAELHHLGTGELVAKTNSDDDFTAVSVDAQGRRHVAWIAYDDELKRNHLFLRDVDNRDSETESIAEFSEFANVQLIALPGSGLRAVWSSPGSQDDWDIYTATRDAGGWQTERLTTTAGTDFQLAAAANDVGTVWLVWQTFRHGNGDISAKCLKNGSWSPEISVTSAKANEWQPSVSVDKRGQAWIGYDSYAHGNYDVFLTSATWDGSQARTGETVAIARSPDFEAHASVHVDGEDRVWVAYDAAGPGWGKDFRSRVTVEGDHYTEPLHASRRMELRCVVNGEVHRPAGPLPQQLPPERIHVIDRTPTAKPSRFYEFPQLAADGDGRMWLLFRLCRQGYCPHPAKGPNWNIYATTFTSNGWLDPIELPRSQGRQNQRVAWAAGPNGLLHCAWSEGNRSAAVDRKYTVQAGTLPRPAESAAGIPLEPFTVSEPGEPEHAPEIPWTIRSGSKEYRVYFGDLHRHTNISRCSPTIDGCLTDAHRYALDAAELDFLAITDHTRDVDPFSWWRTQQAADQFTIPGVYIPIYAYERSNLAQGGGHRNVFFLKRGVPVSRSDHWYTGRGLPQKDADPDTTLYPWMKQQGGTLTAAHTPAYQAKQMRGTWTFNDPQMEPVAEIYQGFRRSYERPADKVRKEASLWHALGKGYRLGFIASSDHISTHVSYACVWATEKTREAIFEGLQSRRTYAATDRIALDMRVGSALMGQETTESGSSIALSIRARGTAPVRAITIVRSGEVIATLTPGQVDVETEYVDSNAPDEDCYYYVRLEQTDGGVAWGSPIWVRR